MSTPNTIRNLLAGTAIALTVAAGGVQADEMMDNENAEKLRDALAQNPELDEYGLSVVADEGKIMIEGMIDDNEDYSLLEQMLGEMEGVDNIENNVVQN